MTHRRQKSDRSLSTWSQRAKIKTRPKSVNRSTRSRSKAKSNRSALRSQGRARSKSRKDYVIGDDGMSEALRRAMRGPSTHREKDAKRRGRVQRRSESAKKKEQFGSIRPHSRSKSRASRMTRSERSKSIPHRLPSSNHCNHRRSISNGRQSFKQRR